MGVLTRLQGVKYIISSDQSSRDESGKRAPRLPSDTYHVWTGEDWSDDVASAMTFDSLDDADEYVRANFNKVTSKR